MSPEDALIFWEGAVTVISLSTTFQDEGLIPCRFVTYSPLNHDDQSFSSVKSRSQESRCLAFKVVLYQGVLYLLVLCEGLCRGRSRKKAYFALNLTQVSFPFISIVSLFSVT